MEETLFRLGGKNSRQLICIAGCDLEMIYVGYIWHMGLSCFLVVIHVC